jgi:acetyl-CoA carboxylase/biotin carboxylase 1
LAQAAFEGGLTLNLQALLPRLSEFLRVEKMFVGKLRDDVVREMTKANADNLSVVILENLAHQRLR